MQCIYKENYNISKPIYRFTTFEWLFEMLINKDLTLLRPKLWDDPYENFLFNQEILSFDGGVIDFKYLTKTIFGQCWTFKYQSDFAWRIYTFNGNGVRIKMIISELHDCILNQIDINTSKLIFGRVQYSSWKKIKELYENPIKFSKRLFPVDILMRQDLFLKRNEFKHEDEFRIIYSDDKLNFEKVNLIKFKIDPNKMIKSILLDPRMSESTFKNYRLIIRQLGYKGEIKKSQLYSIPKLNLKLGSMIRTK